MKTLLLGNIIYNNLKLKKKEKKVTPIFPLGYP